jgi:hypothetical protein
MQPNIPNASTQGTPPADTTAQDKDDVQISPSFGSSTAPLWPWLIALAVVIIALIFALR